MNPCIICFLVKPLCGAYVFYPNTSKPCTDASDIQHIRRFFYFFFFYLSSAFTSFNLSSLTLSPFAFLSSTIFILILFAFFFAFTPRFSFNGRTFGVHNSNRCYPIRCIFVFFFILSLLNASNFSAILNASNKCDAHLPF